MFSSPGAFLIPLLNSRAIQLVRRPPHGDLPQGRQILRSEKILQRLLGLTFPINFSSLKPFYQFIGLDIHQLHLTGPVKHMVGKSLFKISSDEPNSVGFTK